MPSTGKAQEFLKQAKDQFQKECSFKPAIN